MNDLEKSGREVFDVEIKALHLQNLENISMYENGIFEMANYSTEDSGLPYGIWFDESGKFRANKHHAARVKVIMPSGNLIPVSVELNPKILLKGVQLAKAEREFKGKERDEIFKFISKNREVILKHWHGEITTKTLFNSLS